jgi:hypothetical protein
VAFRYEDAFAGGTYLLTSLLYLFEYDGWLVKYRITFPAAQEEKANLVSQVFVSGFLWRSSGEQGAAADRLQRRMIAPW